MTTPTDVVKNSIKAAATMMMTTITTANAMTVTNSQAMADTNRRLRALDTVVAQGMDVRNVVRNVKSAAKSAMNNTDDEMIMTTDRPAAMGVSKKAASDLEAMEVTVKRRQAMVGEDVKKNKQAMVPAAAMEVVAKNRQATDLARMSRTTSLVVSAVVVKNKQATAPLAATAAEDVKKKNLPAMEAV